MFERIAAGQHLKNHNTQTIVVYRVCVFLISNDFRCQILSSPTKRTRLTSFLIKSVLAQPEVSQPNMPFLINQNIFRLNPDTLFLLYVGTQVLILFPLRKSALVPNQISLLSPSGKTTHLH